MKTNVSTLLREFPKVRQVALSGEAVIIKTREGNLRLTADRPAGNEILGSLTHRILRSDDSIQETTSQSDDWKASL